MTEEILEGINTKLGVIIRLLGNKTIEGKGKTEAILTLGALGLDTNMIAEIVGTTTGTVNVRLSEARKKSKS
jgi:hypothetical protein